MEISIHNTYVICKYSEEIGYNTIFMNDTLYTSKEEAQKALIEFEKELEIKIRELDALNVTRIIRYKLKIISLNTFINEVKETMYNAGNLARVIDNEGHIGN
jgi:hypothetical protein